MKKYYYLFLFFSLALITLSSCSNNTEPTNQDNFEINSDPFSIEININSDSLQIENTPNHTIDYSELKLNGSGLSYIKYYPLTQKLENCREFIVAKNDSFSVVINNCKPENEWSIGLEESNPYWLNSEVVLVRTQKIFNVDSTINYNFMFKTLKEGKGYICFTEKNQLGVVSSNESHGLVIGYSTNPLKKISLNVDEIIWKYNIEKGTFSTVSVYIKGTTNIYRLRGMTSGDGILMAEEITIQNDDRFEMEIPVAFSHIAGVTLKSNSELLLYGTVGLPKIIPLINPQNDGQ